MNQAYFSPVNGTDRPVVMTGHDSGTALILWTPQITHEPEPELQTPRTSKFGALVGSALFRLWALRARVFMVGASAMAIIPALVVIVGMLLPVYFFAMIGSILAQ